MSSKTLKTNIVSTAAAMAIALGASSSLWAKSPPMPSAGTSNGEETVIPLLPSHAMPANLLLAMMDDMDEADEMDDSDEMAKMMKKKKGDRGGMMGGKMGDMSGGKMSGRTPAGGSMPGVDSSAGKQGSMADTSDADNMGRMRAPMPSRGGMRNMAPSASLPGFPGASHLYHVGATGFFLDHPQHIELATEQQATLNRIKEKILLDRASFDRRIEDAEQDLWTLTAADAPDAAKIETKIRAIEKLRGDQRLGFIRGVGEAGNVLTADQVAILLGTKPPAGTRPARAAKPQPVAPMPPK